MLFGYTEQKGMLCLITEYISGGNLSNYIRNKELHYSEVFAAKIAINLSNGMKYLHGKNIVHRDLKVS